MSEELQPLIGPLISLLGGDNGTVAQVVAWVGTLRLAIKPLAGKIQSFAQRSVDWVLATEDTRDDALANKVMASWPYRLLVFGMDMCASLKLPTKLTSPQPTGTTETKTGP